MCASSAWLAGSVEGLLGYFGSRKGAYKRPRHRLHPVAFVRSGAIHHWNAQESTWAKVKAIAHARALATA